MTAMTMAKAASFDLDIVFNGSLNEVSLDLVVGEDDDEDDEDGEEDEEEEG